MTDASQTTDLLRHMNQAEIQENIAWWTNLREQHRARGQTIAVRKCQEEIDLWKQELADGCTGKPSNRNDHN